MEFIISILENQTMLHVSSVLTIIFTIILVFLFFHKNGRDERGRGIFATACFIAICVYIILTNAITALPAYILNSPQMLKGFIFLSCNIVLFIQIICTLIISKFK